jgi:hypothetical protein
MMNKEVNGFGQSPIEKITKRLFEAQLIIVPPTPN